MFHKTENMYKLRRKEAYTKHNNSFMEENINIYFLMGLYRENQPNVFN
jgi:hypothetical protein